MPSAEHEGLVELLTNRPDDAPTDLASQRAMFEAMTGDFPLAPGTEVHAYSANGVPVEWVSASGADARRAVVYLHGGGYVIGSLNTHRSLASRISAASGARVMVVDYRLAPEHPYPAAVDDALTAYRWLFTQGIQPEHVAVAGDSAGGGLALALLMQIREHDLPMPAGGVLLSPWVDLEGTGATAAPGAVDDPMVTLEGLKGMAQTYAGDRVAEPLASPLHGDLTGLPPLLIQVGTREVLLDDARRIKARAEAAGVEVTLEEEEGLVHVWQVFPDIPESDSAVARIGAFIDHRLA